MLKLLIPFMSKFVKDIDGATAIEYAMIVVMISLAALILMGNAGVSLEEAFQNISTRLAALR